MLTGLHWSKSEETMETLIYLGGAYHLAWAVFEACWPILFNWKKTLEPLDDVLRALPYLMSRGIVGLYLGIAYFSFFRTEELLHTELGWSLLVFISAIWTFRSIMQIQWFGFLGKANTLRFDRESYRFPLGKLSNQAICNIFMLIFTFGISCYAVPAVLLASS